MRYTISFPEAQIRLSEFNKESDVKSWLSQFRETLQKLINVDIEKAKEWVRRNYENIKDKGLEWTSALKDYLGMITPDDVAQELLSVTAQMKSTIKKKVNINGQEYYVDKDKEEIYAVENPKDRKHFGQLEDDELDIIFNAVFPKEENNMNKKILGENYDLTHPQLERAIEDYNQSMREGKYDTAKNIKEYIYKFIRIKGLNKNKVPQLASLEKKADNSPQTLYTVECPCGNKVEVTPGSMMLSNKIKCDKCKKVFTPTRFTPKSMKEKMLPGMEFAKVKKDTRQELDKIN